MLTEEENDALCRVGPGTPMGTVLRRYWTPAFQLADLPSPDCPPVSDGGAPAGLGEGYDFSAVTAASAIIDAGTAWQDLVPGHQGVPDQVTRRPATTPGSMATRSPATPGAHEGSNRE